MNKKYCLHPGKLKVKVAGRKDNGEASGKADWAMRYFSAEELANSYGVKLEECVIWGRGLKSGDFIHLKPDPKGSYELPVMEAPARGDKPRKRTR